MNVALNSFGSWLSVQPLVEELMPALKIFHVKQKTRTIVKGGKEIKIRDGISKKFENLFRVSAEDGQPPTGLVTYRGLLSHIQEHLQRFGYTVTYQRSGRPFVVPEILPEHFTLLEERPKLKELVLHMLASEGGALVEGATGIGKTSVIGTLVKVFARPVLQNKRRILIVTSARSVVDNLFLELSEIFKGTDVLLGVTHGSAVCIQPVTVSTFKMLHLHPPEEVDVVIVDEVHDAAADDAAAHMLNFPDALKLGVSGTIEDRNDGKELLLEGLFGPIVYKIDDKEAEKLGWVSPQKVFAISVPNGPNVFGLSEYEVERQGIWYNDTRNAIIRAISLALPPEKQLLTFVRTTEHLEHLIEKWLPPGYEIMRGDLKARERRRIQEAFVGGEIKRLISTDCIKQGVNTRNLFYLINANWVGSRIGVMQRRGRNRRLHDEKEHGMIFEFQDEWMEAIIEVQMQSLKQECALEGMELAPIEEPHNMLGNKAKTRFARYRKAGDKVYRVKSVEQINLGQMDLFSGSAS